MRVHCIAIFLCCCLFLKKADGQQYRLYLAPVMGISTIRKVQDNLLPYYYDIKPRPALQFNAGIQLKPIKSFTPIFEIGFLRVGFSGRHFIKIDDTLAHTYFEDQDLHNLNAIKINLLLKRTIVEKKISIEAGIESIVVLKKIITSKHYKIDGLNSRSSIIISNQKVDDNSNNFLLDAHLGLLYEVSRKTCVGVFGNYGISYLRDNRINDFLARQVFVGIKGLYFLK